MSERICGLFAGVLGLVVAAPAAYAAIDYAPPENDFRVQFVGQPQLTTMATPPTRGYVDLERPSLYEVSVEDHAAGDIPAAPSDDLYQTALHNLVQASGMNLVSSGWTTLSGHRALGAELDGGAKHPGVKGLVRFTMSGPHLYTVTYLHPVGQGSEDEAKRFFDSFQLQGQ
jgi:hypothetical protein